MGVFDVGSDDGVNEGRSVGWCDGASEIVGSEVGMCDGCTDGEEVGKTVGLPEGSDEVGAADGAEVG